MRVMVIVKATPASEAGLVLGPELDERLAEMGALNDELVKAGLMVTGAGLRPSSNGKRLLIGADGGKRVVDGPFPATTELVAGFWIWEVDSMETAMDWASRYPHPMPGHDATLEVRPFYEEEDFQG